MNPNEQTDAPENVTDPRLSERDSLDRPFDPAKFKHEKDSLGRWKNLNAGRRRKAAATTGETAATPAETPAPANLPPPDFADIEAAAGAPEAEAEAEPGRTEPAAPTDATLSPAAGGNLLARVLYKITGTITGDHKAAVAKGDEHKAIAGTFAAYLGFRGLALVGGLALGATVLSYLLDDARGESVTDAFKRFLRKKPQPGDGAKRAEPVTAPTTSEPAAPAAPVEVVSTHPANLGTRY